MHQIVGQADATSKLNISRINLDDTELSRNEKAGIIKKGALTMLPPLWSGGILVFFFVRPIRVTM
jgi:hypothetical protein